MDVKYVQRESILDFTLKTQAEQNSHLALH